MAKACLAKGWTGAQAPVSVVKGLPLYRFPMCPKKKSGQRKVRKEKDNHRTTDVFSQSYGVEGLNLCNLGRKMGHGASIKWKHGLALDVIIFK